MPTFNNGESGSSVRTKLNTIINKVEGAATIENDILFGDNDKAIFGAGSDLQIYHDGITSVIAEVGSGDLRLKGTNIDFKSATNETYAYFQADGASILYHDGSAKLATTATGIDVTGTAEADGLTLDSSNPTPFVLKRNGGEDSNTNINFEQASYSTWVGAGSTGDFVIGRNADLSVQRGFAVANNGDVSFYEDTGTTAKFFWDASAESLGIGTTTPGSKLSVVGLPTSSAGLSAGDIWNDSGTLKIV